MEINQFSANFKCYCDVCVVRMVCPPDQAPPDQAPPPQQTTTVADGTHPTGMHSCLFNDLILIYFQALLWLFLFIALAVTADDL